MLQYQVQVGPNSALAVSKMHVLKTWKLHFVGGGGGGFVQRKDQIFCYISAGTAELEAEGVWPPPQ